MLIYAFSKALKNLLLPDILKLFFLCLLVYMFAFLGIAWVISAIIATQVDTAFTGGLLLQMAGSIGGMVVAWFLFPLLYPILMSFFDDHMAVSIEREDYPHLPVAEPPFWPTLRADALFSLKAIGLNILCLPLYLIPLLGLLIYYCLNGYLLGMQFFRMAAGRRVSVAETKSLQRRARGSILLAGVVISVCSTIPLLNLAAPVIGVASMLHLFHALVGNHKQNVLPPL